MKLAFVVHRYGREILGGSETLARQLAERLSRRHDITVLTTTAKDYITWKNEYPEGEEKLRGVRIRRFPVEGERDIDEFNRFSEEIYEGQPSRERELEWLQRQGPVVPKLIEYLEKEHDRYDLLVFFTYLYYPTYYGLKVAPEKSVLVPTAHDEPPLRLGIFKDMFQLPSSFLFNTEAEELLVLERFGVHKKMRETVGMGMDLLDQPDASAFRKKHKIPGVYLLYAGRIDGGKGLEELFRFFSFFKEEYPATGNMQLVLIGKLGMKLPEDPSIRYIGFVDEADKLSAMAGALTVVQPSKMESLSIVTLEAFAVGTPILANGNSRVLVDHCRKANAGFYYRDFEEFEAVLGLLLSDRNLARNLGRNGQRYVKENYGWNKLLPKFELVFRSSARPSKEQKEARARPEPPSPPERPVAEQPEREAPPPSKEKPAPVEEAGPEGVGPEGVGPEGVGPEGVGPEGVGKEPADRGTSAGETTPSTEQPRVEERPSPVVVGAEESLRRDVRVESEAGKGSETEAPRAEGEPAQPESEEEVDPELAHLPAFFRASVPPKPPRPVEPEEDEPPDTQELERVEPSDEEAGAEVGREEEETEEELAEGELPAFYRPRPKNDETAEEENAEPDRKGGEASS